jgi:hypothetical protein
MSTVAEPVYPHPRRVSKRRAARHAGINPHTLDEFIAEVGLTVYKAGKNVYRIDLNELDQAMRDYGKQEATA